MTSADIRTKELIAGALKKLAKTMRLSSISVNKIANECGISRNTFYYHFRDIPSAIHWTLQYELPLLPPSEKETEIEDYFYQQVYQIFCYVRDNRELFLCIEESSCAGEFRQIYIQDLSVVFCRLVSRFQEETNCSNLYACDFSHFLTITLLEILNSWGHDEIKKTPEAMADFTRSISRIFLAGGQFAI